MSNYSLRDGFLCDPTLAVHRNSSQISTMIILVSGINIALSITATLGNTLILVALHKESSLNPPSKLLLRCLAFSDLFVGLLVQPAAVVSFFSAVYHRWNLCRIGETLWYGLSTILAIFTFATLSAMSIDRLLALLLGIRYKHVVTMKRARLLVAVFLLLSIADCVLQYTDIFGFLAFTALMWLLWLITSVYCYVRIYFVLRNLIRAQVTPEGQPCAVSLLNLARYKKSVSTALWIFGTMIVSFAPLGLALIVSVASSGLNASLVITNYFTITTSYLNSSLNPALYYWKMRELKYEVNEILRNLSFCKMCSKDKVTSIKLRKMSFKKNRELNGQDESFEVAIPEVFSTRCCRAKCLKVK